MAVSLPDDYLIEIGKVSVQWSMLEMVFDLCSIKLAGMDADEARAMAVFAHMPFQMKLDVFGAMVDSLQTNYPRLKSYAEVLSLVRQAQSARNKIIHARWSHKNGVVTIGRMTARGKVKTSIDTISLDEIRSATELIGKASVQVWKLVISGSQERDNGPTA